MIGRYEGRRYVAGESIESAREDGITYLFALSDGGTIDGGEGGNETRFINHSCAPNCEAREARDAREAGDDEGDLVVEVQALKAIPAGAELFIDYRLIRDPADEHAYTCRCGSPKCRGTMVWAEA